MDQSAAESGRELEVNSGDLSAAVYYSVAESCTHWFIVYAFFHSRDWVEVPWATARERRRGASDNRAQGRFGRRDTGGCHYGVPKKKFYCDWEKWVCSFSGLL